MFDIFWYWNLRLNKGNFKKRWASELNTCTERADFYRELIKIIALLRAWKDRRYFNLRLPKAGSLSALTLQFHSDSFSKYPGLLFSSSGKWCCTYLALGRFFSFSLTLLSPSYSACMQSYKYKLQWVSSMGIFCKNHLLDAKVQLRELLASKSKCYNLSVK